MWPEQHLLKKSLMENFNFCAVDFGADSYLEPNQTSTMECFAYVFGWVLNTSLKKKSNFLE